MTTRGAAARGLPVQARGLRRTTRVRVRDAVRSRRALRQPARPRRDPGPRGHRAHCAGIELNGGFHYLDADPATFGTVDKGVLAHRATLGNVEYALTVDDTEAGCGCDYPDYISDSVVAESNAVVARLRATANALPDHLTRLAALPRHLTAAVGVRRVGIVHGDPESLAGWKLALEAVEPADPDARARSGFAGAPTPTAQVSDWCRRARSRWCAARTPACPTRRTTARTSAATSWRTMAPPGCPTSSTGTTV